MTNIRFVIITDFSEFKASIKRVLCSNVCFDLGSSLQLYRLFERKKYYCTTQDDGEGLWLIRSEDWKWFKCPRKSQEFEFWLKIKDQKLPIVIRYQLQVLAYEPRGRSHLTLPYHIRVSASLGKTLFSHSLPFSVWGLLRNEMEAL